MNKWCTYCRKDNHNDTECWSTRAVVYDSLGKPSIGESMGPNSMYVPVPQKSGFERDPFGDVFGCLHPEHNPPTHLAIPAGQRYRHICPGCRLSLVLRPSAFFAWCSS